MKSRTTEYRVLHLWVERQLGKPSFCVKCKSTDKSRYEWANISGEYKKDTADWQRMCFKCHRIMDGQINISHCKKGHELTEANTYFRHATNRRECRECRRLNHVISNPKRIRGKLS